MACPMLLGLVPGTKAQAVVDPRTTKTNPLVLARRAAVLGVASWKGIGLEAVAALVAGVASVASSFEATLEASSLAASLEAGSLGGFIGWLPPPPSLPVLVVVVPGVPVSARARAASVELVAKPWITDEFGSTVRPSHKSRI